MDAKQLRYEIETMQEIADHGGKESAYAKKLVIAWKRVYRKEFGLYAEKPPDAHSVD